jgi:hypothetical protein
LTSVPPRAQEQDQPPPAPKSSCHFLEKIKMRQIMTVSVGTLLTYSVMASAAIAQVYYNCLPLVSERPVPMNLLNFGQTQQGDSLYLSPYSLERTRGGVQFTYALNGQPIQGFTTCNGVWTANGRKHRATSDAAKRMLNYVCGDRVTRY